MENTGGLDDVRYAHHLKHRGQHNQHLAQSFWLGICCIVGVVGARRAWAWCVGRRTKTNPRCQPSPLSLFLSRCVALCRAASLSTFRRVSFGRILISLVHAGFLVLWLTSIDAPLFSTHFLDDVAFRAAWVTVSQVPLIYLLSTKRGPLNLLTGISHERINWLHRWTGRTVLLCATGHMAIMMSSVYIVDLIKSPDQAMTVVRYGAGAYGTLAWIAGSSILPLRRWSYRVFHLNHWVFTLVFLGFVARHVPSYARLPVYASIAIVAIDKGLCALTFLSNNITVRSSNKKSARYKPDYDRQVLAMGHPVKMMTPFIMNSTVVPKESATVIRISDVAFPWRPGQYVRLYIPKLGALEMHPFTPATCSDVSASPKLPPKDGDVEHHGLLPHNTTATTNDLLFMIKAHSGWTKRLSDYHAEWLALPCPNASRPSSALTAYVDGPYGTAPVWESYENMILIASSTGVTFLLSILDYLEQLCFDAKSWPRTRRIHIIWANRHTEPQLEATVSDLLSRHTALLRESDTKVEVHFYTTCTEAVDEQVSMPDPFAHMRQSRPRYFARRRPLRIRNPNIPWTEEEEEEEEEAAWCEDDNVECTAMQHPSNADDMSRRSSCESTLIGDDPGHSDFDAMNRELDSSCWSRLSSLRLWRREKITASANACQCAHLRHEQQKLRMKSPPEYVSRFYGERPDIASILTTSIPQLGIQSTMVVVCANERVIDTAKSVVSRMNMEYARGRRKAGVMIHTEGFD